MFEEDFDGRVLAFDGAAAYDYAIIASHRRQAGKPISQFDAQIAAIARSRGAVVATRNVSDFEDCGIDVAQRSVERWVEHEPGDPPRIGIGANQGVVGLYVGAASA